MNDLYLQDPIIQGLIETIKEISSKNNYNFSKEDCINIVEKMWSDIPFIVHCGAYADRYFNKNNLIK